MRLLSKSEKYTIYLRLLKLYQKFEILWNPKHPHYGSEFYRENAWKFFAELIRIENITPKDCKLKIKIIRAHYIKQRKELTEKELEVMYTQKKSTHFLLKLHYHCQFTVGVPSTRVVHFGRVFFGTHSLFHRHREIVGTTYKGK
jgi:hypothetical protein